MVEKPKTNNPIADKQLDQAEKQFKEFDASIKEMTMDRMNLAPKEEREEQTKLSQREISKIPDHYLKPYKTIGSREKFNEKYREAYNFDKVYVPFIAEHNELQGETIDLWTKPYAGCPAEEWLVPTGTPVWGPRYLAEQIKRKYYHRLTMKENVTTGQSGEGTYYGKMAADTTVQRLDARPVNQKKSVFMGAEGF